MLPVSLYAQFQQALSLVSYDPHCPEQNAGHWTAGSNLSHLWLPGTSFAPILWPLSLHTLCYSYLRMCFTSSVQIESPWEQNYVLCIFISHNIISKANTFRTMFSIKIFSILSRIYWLPLYREYLCVLIAEDDTT